MQRQLVIGVLSAMVGVFGSSCSSTESVAPDTSDVSTQSAAADEQPGSPDDSVVATTAAIAPDDSVPPHTAGPDLEDGVPGLLVSVDIDQGVLSLCTEDGAIVDYEFAEGLGDTIDLNHLVEHLDLREPVLVLVDESGRAAQILDIQLSAAQKEAC